eukprot:gene435-518_t
MTLYKRLATLPGNNLKKVLGEIKEGKLGTHHTVANFKEDLNDQTNPSNTAVRQLGEKECSFDGVHLINSEAQLKRAFEIINREHVVAFDLEGVEMGKQGQVALVQLALMNGTVFLFDICALGQAAFTGGLKETLESRTVLKIVHDCRRDSEILYHRHSVNLDHVYDVQIAHALLQKKEHGNVPIRRFGLQELTHLYAPREFSARCVDIKYKAREQFTMNGELWSQRPLPPLLIDYASLDVILLHPIYNTIHPQLQRPFDKKFLKKNFKEQLTYFKDSVRQLFARNLI